MIFTNLIGPVRIARPRIRKNPFATSFVRSFSVLPKNHGLVTIHRKRLCGTFCLRIFHELALHLGQHN